MAYTSFPTILRDPQGHSPTANAIFNFLYSYSAADKISTDITYRTVPVCHQRSSLDS